MSSSARCRASSASSLWFARQAEILAEARQLESLHRLSTFVMHDIKNHVSGLSLMLENARKHIANPDFQKDALGVLERTVESLRELMQQVSGVARPGQLHPEEVNVDELVREAVDTSGLGSATEAGVTLQVDVDTNGPVLLDRSQMVRLLTNLLINARESMEDGGCIRLHAATESSNGSDARLRFSVQDDGRGMTEEFVRDSLFRPFATTKSGGLGIGLAQCRSIVEAHGGTIAVDSRLGHGTTFTVELPVGAGNGKDHA